MSRSLWFVPIVTLFLFLALSRRVDAQEATCGAPPSLPTSAQTEESIKGQLQGQADFLSKLVGKAELSGEVAAAKKQIYQSSDQFFAAQKEAYLSYLFCILITQDKSLSTEQKLKALATYRNSTPDDNADHKTGSLQKTPSLDHSIGFQCAWSEPPSHYREDKTLFIVGFQGVPVTGINPNQELAGPMSFIRSSEPFMASNQWANEWYRCDITNYSTQAVRNLRAKFPVQYAEAETTQNGTQSGKVIASGYALTPSFDLGTGVAGSDYFYFANGTAFYILVSVPTTARLQSLADDEWHIVKLIAPSIEQGAFGLTPSTNPIGRSTPTPPTPAAKQ